ncbi:MAG TPA: hypothetical protein DCL54_11320, partial [Alphaproteobacteria bacterium]|nr:hypothetical protein [Alphaproteobacteria bacterium]
MAQQDRVGPRSVQSAKSTPGKGDRGQNLPLLQGEACLQDRHLRGIIASGRGGCARRTHVVLSLCWRGGAHLCAPGSIRAKSQILMTVSSPPQPNDLTRLREAIDQVDNQLADLLLQRFAMGAAVAQAKRGQAAGLNMRPEREVEILRRLAARWQGPAPVGVMAVIWRQIISAVLQMQGPLRVVAPVLDDGAVAVLAREHFGLTVPIEAGG